MCNASSWSLFDAREEAPLKYTLTLLMTFQFMHELAFADNGLTGLIVSSHDHKIIINIVVVVS